jgi:hypothetical protein
MSNKEARGVWMHLFLPVPPSVCLSMPPILVVVGASVVALVGALDGASMGTLIDASMGVLVTWVLLIAQVCSSHVYFVTSTPACLFLG